MKVEDNSIYTITRSVSYEAESVIVVCVLKLKPFIDLLSNKRNTIISADYFIIIVIIIISSSSSSSLSSSLSLLLLSLSSPTTITIMAVDNQLKKYHICGLFLIHLTIDRGCHR
uniref:Uncharacterized protein n=1 Tax=Glossina austeni TaxID=7395 RepID=A0A1A9UZ85_GLOAU